jgi:imidazolonepropionase-like amidohydrolase
VRDPKTSPAPTVSALLALVALVAPGACARRPAQARPAVAALANAPVVAPELCLIGGQVVDPDERAVLRADVLIRGGAIAAVGPDAAKGCRGQRLELGGAYVMPALVDLHVHAWGNPSPTGEETDEEPGREAVMRLVLRTGVTALLDLGGDNQERIALRDRLRASPEHASLLVGTPVFGGRGRRRGFATAPGEREAELRASVREVARLRPDVVKVFAFVPGFPAIIAEARALGLATVVHIETWEQADTAVRAGATAITHLEDEVVIPAELAALMGKLGTRSIPTMAVQCDLARFVDAPALLDDPLLARVTGPALRAAYRDGAHYTERAVDWMSWQRDGCVAHDFASLRRLHAAGVSLLAGSDTGNLGTFQGYSLHREIELMAEAGLPVWDVLRGATTEAARFVHLDTGLHPGAPANLIVLAASPVEDVRNTRRIVHVVHAGRLLAP